MLPSSPYESVQRIAPSPNSPANISWPGKADRWKPSAAVRGRHSARSQIHSRERGRRRRELQEPGRRGERGLGRRARRQARSEEHTSELQSRQYLVCRLLLEKKKKKTKNSIYTTTLLFTS